MSVGGTVTEVLHTKHGKTWINTLDRGAECAIFVKTDTNSKHVSTGDIVWWQGSVAFWTTQDRVSRVEVELKRLGFSGVNRPKKDYII